MRVNIDRVVNGIPFNSDAVRVFINNETGRVISMNAAWSRGAQAPDPGNAISKEDAEARYMERSGLELVYRDMDGKAALVYQPYSDFAYIDAITGEKAERDEAWYGATAELAVMGDMSMGGGYAPLLTEREIQDIERYSELISPDDAEQNIRSIAGIDIEGLDRTNYKYTAITAENREGSYKISLTFARDGKSAYATLDAETGELLYFYTRGAIRPASDEKIAAGRAQDAAWQFLSDNAPREVGDARLYAENSWEDGYTFAYHRYVNDVRHTSDAITIEVDPYTGNISRYNKNWDRDKVFESTENSISEQEAGIAVFEQAGLVMRYVDMSSYTDIQYDIRLVYQLDAAKPHYLRASDGKLIYASGEEYSGEGGPVSKAVTDIAGHYGETAITALLDHHFISLEEGQEAFRPDDEITQKEMLGFVMSLKGYMSDPVPLDVQRVYSYAKSAGIIKDSEIDADAPVSRELAAKFIIRAIGYEDVAELSGIYNTGFSDAHEITAGYEGYVALAKGFGIVRGDGGNNFHPKDNVLRADAAIMIYNYLVR